MDGLSPGDTFNRPIKEKNMEKELKAIAAIQEIIKGFTPAEINRVFWYADNFERTKNLTTNTPAAAGIIGAGDAPQV